MFIDEFPDIKEIPNRLPVSGESGSKRLKRLLRRAEHLKKRIIAARPHELSHDIAEVDAIQWAIKAIIIFENLFKNKKEK